MGVTPKSSILIGSSIINKPFWGNPHSRKPPYNPTSNFIQISNVFDPEIPVPGAAYSAPSGRRVLLGQGLLRRDGPLHTGVDDHTDSQATWLKHVKVTKETDDTGGTWGLKRQANHPENWSCV